jgi:hypothetical protein
LVKSPPELWAECSNAASLARHLGQFGEIRITKLKPEISVAWEGSAVRGTVRLEPSGWGTKVFLTATGEGAPPDPEPDAPPEPEAEAPPEPGAAVRRGPFARLMAMFRGVPAAAKSEPEPEPAAPLPEPRPTPTPPERRPAPPTRPANPLDAALDSLGRAHHRPYSRA